MGEVPGAPPIAPGGAFEFEVEAEPGQRLSFASMYVPSNDLFVSPVSGIEAFDGEEPVEGDVTDDVALWDAGTEVNGSPVTGLTGAPRQGNNGGPAAGPTEGVVHPVSAINDGFDYLAAEDVVSVSATPGSNGNVHRQGREHGTDGFLLE
jgi:Spondin_N.